MEAATVALEEETLAELKAICKAENRKLSYIMRTIIKEGLDARRQNSLASSTDTHVGHTNGSRLASSTDTHVGHTNGSRLKQIAGAAISAADLTTAHER